MRIPNPRGQRGITLVEVIVALTILSIVLIALGGLMFQVGKQTRSSAATTYRSAALQRAAAWVDGLPWDSSTTGIIGGCTSDSSGLMAYDRCTTVVDSTSRLRKISVVVVPNGIFTAVPETIVVYRNKPRPASPLR
jgi:prepilin-type N-terminal cleavage/methylation domain-containing protein